MNDKTINKPEQAEKEPLDARKRDRGDNFKKQDGMKNKLGDGVHLKVARKQPFPNQGDVPVISKGTSIPKPTYSINKIDEVIYDKGKKQNEIKPKLTLDVSSKVNAGADKMSINKTSKINNAAVNKTRFGEKALNHSQVKDIKNTVKPDLKTEHLKTQLTLKAARGIISDSNKSNTTKTDSDVIKKEDLKAHRKPLIKTVKSKNDNRVYKAVTFTEQKRIKPTILEINIPNIQAKKTKMKLVDKNLEVKPASLQGTSNKSTGKLNTNSISQYGRRNRGTERIKRKKLNRCISSPDKFKKVDSPPTEVAKWGPSCLNTHTKPYYEAWVNTTLAAISKISRKDKLYLEKQNIIKTFQKSLELGTESPNSIHENYTDECYTGKIKIKQRGLSKKSRQPLIRPLIDVNKNEI